MRTLFFFFQAEDGIRDPLVTGVQTCALPICVACKICEKECPPQCIYIVKSEDKKPDYMGKPQFYPAVFDIDISVCMSCQICVEVCPFEAIKMDKDFELSRRERFNALLMRKRELSKSNDYYHRICPTDE